MLISPNNSPALVGLLPKAHYSAQDDALAIRQACQSAVGTAIPMPIFYGRRQLGWAVGQIGSPKVAFIRDPKSLDKAAPLWASINTYNDIIAACASGNRLPIFWTKAATSTPVALNWYDLWAVGGMPAAGTYTGTAYTALAHSNADTGSLAINGNVSPLVRCVTSVSAAATAGATPPCLWLYDRVVDYRACAFNNNANHAFTNGSTPPGGRYSSGSQSGMQCVVTAQTVFSATAQSFTLITYANQAGTASQVAPTSTTTTNIIVSAAAPTASLGARVVSPAIAAASTSVSGPFMPLATGDTGVQYLQNFTTSAATINTGTMCFVLLTPLVIIPLGTAAVYTMIDTVNMVPNLSVIFDGACLSFMAFFPVATAATLTGLVDVAWN